MRVNEPVEKEGAPPKLKVSLPVVNVPGATGQTGLTKMLTAPADVTGSP